MNENFCPNTRNNEILIQEVAGELLVYDLKTHKAFCLNSTSALVWRRCNGKRTSTQIAVEISREIKTAVEVETVWLALDQLDKEGLLDNGEESESPFTELSRREIIRRVGFGSTIGLPIVSSIIAPRSFVAQSLGGLNSPCTTTPQCTAGLTCITTGSFPSACCLGTFETRPPGSILCAADQPACDTNAAMNCCSGAGTLGSPGTCAPGIGLIECVCN